MADVIEINNMGESIKIDVTESTTASDVCEIVNARWPGCAHVCSMIASMGDAFGDTAYSVASFVAMLRKEKAEQKAESIARAAEARQRFQKGRHFV